METITEILKKYDTDKESFHHYGKPYEEIFSKFNREDKLNILEVGTQKGGSLLAWREYFPNANVYGVDIIDIVSDEYKKDTVTRVISDIKEWKNDIEWDIVIDDGSHHISDLAWVIAHYSVKLKIGGVMVIEDVRNPSLLFRVIENILEDLEILYPNLDTKATFDGKYYDTSAPDSRGSFIIALFKEKK